MPRAPSIPPPANNRPSISTAAEMVLNNAERARKLAEARRAADTLTPLPFPVETLPEPPARIADDEPADLPTIEIQTTVEHRGRSFTVVSRGYTLDQLCDMLDKRKYAAPAQTQEWQTLPDGTPICGRHKVPMRKRSKQNDTWFSHQVIDGNGNEVYCKGYRGKDSPGYDVE